MGNGMNKIVPGLYIGSIYDSRNQEKLKENGITHILSIHDKDQVNIPNYNYLRIFSHDSSSEDISHHFRQCIEFIHQTRLNGKNVLVHCLAGISRSVTIVTAYLMVLTGKPLIDVLNAVKQQRSCASPNTGFKLQLKKFEDVGLQQERQNLRNKFGILDAFGDTSLVESLSKQYAMTSQQDSKTKMSLSNDNEDYVRPSRSRIAGMAISSSDYFATAEMNQLSINDDCTGNGSISRRVTPLNKEVDVDWKNVEKYENEECMMEE